MRPPWDTAAAHVVDQSAPLSTRERETFSPSDASPPCEPLAYITLEASPTRAQVSFCSIAENVWSWNSCKRTPAAGGALEELFSGVNPKALFPGVG